VNKLTNIVKGHLYTRHQPVLLVKNVTKARLMRIAENHTALPGIYWQNNPYRVYPFKSLGAHLLGYVGPVNKEELEEHTADREYQPNFVIGKSGLEAGYDRELRGKCGEIVRLVDAHNQIKKTYQARDPVPGSRLILTIDNKWQQAAEKVLEGETGAVIVSNPNTGEILAMASSPTFDPNIFIGDVDPESYRKLSENKKYPFLNRCISAMYPPSSTFKIVTLAAALEEEIVNENTQYLCQGYFKFENEDHIFRCWGIHGWTGTKKSIAVSCDVYYYNVGYMLGSEKISRYARGFGLDELTGIDLPGESRGFLPTHAWKKKTFREIWYDGDTINMAIGQGFLLTTPLQMHNVVSAIATGGIIYQPYVVSKILNSANNSPLHIFTSKILRNISISPKNLGIIRDGMAQVMTWGTGGIVGRASKIKVYGKTGTAQSGDNKVPHAWFVGYTDKEKGDQQYAITAFLENTGGGGDQAVPIAMAVLQSVLRDQDPGELKKYFFDRIAAVMLEFRNMNNPSHEGEVDEKFKDIKF
jgi:penicillin-binding protein 2